MTKTITFEVIHGKYAGNKIIEQSSASIDSLRLYALALVWRLVSVE